MSNLEIRLTEQGLRPLFEKVARAAIEEQLAKLKPMQREIFKKMYGSMKALPVERMDWAYIQITRTIAKNEKGGK